MPFCLSFRLSDCISRLPSKLSVCSVGFQIALSAFRLPCRISVCPVGFQFALSISVYPVSLSFYICYLCPISDCLCLFDVPFIELDAFIFNAYFPVILLLHIFFHFSIYFLLVSQEKRHLFVTPWLLDLWLRYQRHFTVTTLEEWDLQNLPM